MGYNDSISLYILIFCVQPQKVLTTKIRGTLSEICTFVKWEKQPHPFHKGVPLPPPPSNRVWKSSE